MPPQPNPNRWERTADGSYVRRDIGTGSRPSRRVATAAATVEADIDFGIETIGAAHPPAMLEATEAALTLAEERGVDLAAVQGTGKEGRITKADVEAVSE